MMSPVFFKCFYTLTKTSSIFYLPSHVQVSADERNVENTECESMFDPSFNLKDKDEICLLLFFFFSFCSPHSGEKNNRHRWYREIHITPYSVCKNPPTEGQESAAEKRSWASSYKYKGKGRRIKGMLDYTVFRKSMKRQAGRNIKTLQWSFLNF